MNGAEEVPPAPGGGGRAIPPAGARPRPGVRILRMSAIAMGALIAGVVALGIRNNLTAGPQGRDGGQFVAEIAGPEADAVLRALRVPERREPRPAAGPPPPAPAEEPPPAPALRETPLPAPVAAVPADVAEIRRRKRESPVLVYRRSQGGAGEAAIANLGQGAFGLAGEGFPGAGGATSLEGRLRASSFEPVRAEILEGLDMRILEGTVIACILESAISSIVPGMTLCRTRVPVYSEDGAFELIPAGSRVIGEYQGGVESGHARIFVLWRRLITPDGVSAALASPGAGPLGRGGHDGYLDRKWAERFAAAVMVSLVASAVPDRSGDAAQAVATAVQGVATEAVRGAFPAVPELVKLQGEQISIVVARDLDFSAAMRKRFEAAGRGADVMLFGEP